MNMKSVRGMTIAEVLLVLAIAGMIMVFGIRQYASFRSDADVQQLQYNIDQLFEAMNAFYIANCGGKITGTTPTASGGSLFIYAFNNAATSPVPPYPIDLKKDLVDNGYMTRPLPFSPLVDNTAPGLDYILQFNETTNPHPNGGTIVSWKMQVAVLLKNQNLNSAYKAYLNAKCISKVKPAQSGGLPTVDVCTTTTPQNATYLVFERVSTNASQKQVSDLSQSIPELMQFKQMYEISRIPTTNQYYSCGS